MNEQNDELKEGWHNFRENMSKIPSKKRKCFLKFLLKNNIYNSYIKNCLACAKEGDFITPANKDWPYADGSNFIMWSFVWGATEESHIFWSKHCIALTKELAKVF